MALNGLEWPRWRGMRLESDMNHSTLTAKQERALLTLMGERTLDEAAKSARVGQRTLRRWLQQPIFAASMTHAHLPTKGLLFLVMSASPCYVERGDHMGDLRVGAAAGVAVGVTEFWLS